MLRVGLRFARQQFRPLRSFGLHCEKLLRLGSLEFLLLLRKHLAVFVGLRPVSVSTIAIMLHVGLHLLSLHL